MKAHFLPALMLEMALTIAGTACADVEGVYSTHQRVDGEKNRAFNLQYSVAR